MTDLKNGGMPFDTRALYLSEASLKQGINLFLLSHRNIMSQDGEILKRYNLGSAHARILHAVACQPGLTIAELLHQLQITKQSLNRVLNELLSKAYVERRAGRGDRRTRALWLTARGTEITDALWAVRRPLMAAAFRAAGQEAVEGFRTVLARLATETDEERLAAPPGRVSIAP